MNPFSPVRIPGKKVAVIMLLTTVFWLTTSSLSGCGKDPKDPDLIQPVLVMTLPVEGDTFLLGSRVPIAFQASDNDEMNIWVINVNNETIGNSAWAISEDVTGNSIIVNREFTITASGPTEYEVIVTAIDASQNEAIEKRTFFAVP